MTEDTKRIIEIEGVKIEVDLRNAKRVDILRVGSAVKVLVKNYNNYSVHTGVVVGFDAFEKLPTILIAYINKDYLKTELNLLAFNAESKDIEIVMSDPEDIYFDREEVEKWFDRERETKEREIAELESKRAYFRRHFGKLFDSELVEQ